MCVIQHILTLNEIKERKLLRAKPAFTQMQCNLISFLGHGDHFVKRNTLQKLVHVSFGRRVLNLSKSEGTLINASMTQSASAAVASLLLSRNIDFRIVNFCAHKHCTHKCTHMIWYGASEPMCMRIPEATLPSKSFAVKYVYTGVICWDLRGGRDWYSTTQLGCLFCKRAQRTNSEGVEKFPMSHLAEHLAQARA